MVRSLLLLLVPIFGNGLVTTPSTPFLLKQRKRRRKYLPSADVALSACFAFVFCWRMGWLVALYCR
ncbi:uncharacterized protein GGS25DRAFT_108811 [Hypoxylon fragiforme]|uniref:uncharacterized protein n=1 Tax=Hypoxylon fragiforme TaxID=63214 RepID=UPI0020C5FE9A|nr:uncharacterized protein GGS25DRAFT_108811 [Hypoxylon fragiforme]KAI2612162.1 hypothetical protein GGS25DRAFT_108811 [Hypoxylon fragiforme]